MVNRNKRSAISRATRGQSYLYLSVFLFGASVLGLVDGYLWSAKDVTPVSQRFGWDESKAVTEAPRIAAQMPAFAITDSDCNRVTAEGKLVELWKFGKLANGGKHIPTWKQESGDCVSMGWSNAVAYRQAFQIAVEKHREVLKIPFPPFMYGVSRVLIGKRQLGRGAGSVGAWAAQGSISYGVLSVDKADELGFKYSGRLADAWGWTGPPKETTAFAKDFRIKTVSPVKSWEDARDAIGNGYPVTVASNVGFDGGEYVKDGKRFLRRAGSWPHQMCLIGVEDRPGKAKAAYVINSWGADWGARPANDEPPGGFWADWRDVQAIVSQGDSWAYSDFDGFPAPNEDLSWDAFRTESIEIAENTGNDELKQAVSAAETPEPEDTVKEVRKSWALPASYTLLFAASVTLLVGLRLRRSVPRSLSA